MKLKVVNKPVPKDNEVLVKINATSVTTRDCEIRGFRVRKWIWIPLRLFFDIVKTRIKILGMELAGDIVETGKDVNVFRKGDKIFANTGFNFGSYAEYTCIATNSKEQLIVKKPDNISYEEAATVTVGCMTALGSLKKANIQKDKKCLYMEPQNVLEHMLCNLLNTLEQILQLFVVHQVMI